MYAKPLIGTEFLYVKLSGVSLYTYNMLLLNIFRTKPSMCDPVVVVNFQMGHIGPLTVFRG